MTDGNFESPVVNEEPAAQAPTDTAQVNPVPQPVTPEQMAQFEAIKKAMTDHLHKHYMEFVSKIANYPCFKPGQAEAFKFFDTGFLWYRSAIENTPFQNMQMVVQAPANTAPAPAPEAA